MHTSFPHTYADFHGAVRLITLFTKQFHLLKSDIILKIAGNLSTYLVFSLNYWNKSQFDFHSLCRPYGLMTLPVMLPLFFL